MATGGSHLIGAGMGLIDALGPAMRDKIYLRNA
jgi:hypothetical protein